MMAVHFIDGFDHYGTDPSHMSQKWDVRYYGKLYSGGRFGSGAFWQGTLPYGYLAKLMPGAATYAVGFGYMFEPSYGGAGNYMVAFLNGGNEQFRLSHTFGTGLDLEVYDANGTLVAAYANAFPRLTWIHVQVKVTAGNPGSYEVRLNEATVMSGSGDFQTGSASVHDEIRIGAVQNGDFDDLYIADDFLGDLRVITLYPQANGTYFQWTPSAGSNYQNVDESAPDLESSYNSADTAGAKDSYDMQAVGLTGAVKAIQTLAYVRKDDAGSRTVRLLTRSGGTDYFGPDEPVNDSYHYIRQIRETDPATGLGWTVAGVDAAEFGVELVS